MGRDWWGTPDPDAEPLDPQDEYDRWCDNQREWAAECRMEAEADAAAQDPMERQMA